MDYPSNPEPRQSSENATRSTSTNDENSGAAGPLLRFDEIQDPDHKPANDPVREFS